MNRKRVKIVVESLPLWIRSLLLGVVLSTTPLYVLSQENPWFFGIHMMSNNVWMTNVLSLAEALINVPIANATQGKAPVDFTVAQYHYMTMKDNGEKVGIKRNNPYGFKAYDLFNSLEFGFKVGWLGSVSPIGIYVSGAYSLNQYKLCFLGDLDYNLHRIQSLRPGVGIRVSPLYFLMEEHEWCPIFEVGTTYVYNFKYKGPNENDIHQLNNGMRTSYALGVILNGGASSVMVSFDMSHYDLFNRSYTPNGGFWFPFANFKSKDMNIS